MEVAWSWILFLMSVHSCVMASKQLETIGDFDYFLKTNERVVIDFYAMWCGSCSMISPKVEEMAKEFTNVAFAKVRASGGVVV